MKNNAGISLVELMVVIAIMGIVATGMGTLIYSRSNWDCRNANETVTTALSETRTNALAKSNAWMKISYDSGKNCYILSTSYGEDEEFGKHLKIYYSTDAGDNSERDLRTSTPLILSYSRASGAFQGMISDIYTTTTRAGKTVYSFAYITRDDGGVTKNVNCTGIRITDGTHQYTITLYPVTGRFESEEG